MVEDTQFDPVDRDEALLLSARNAPEGDLRAFEQLVALYQKRILADCRYLTRDDANFEDLAQEVFVKAFFGLSTFEGRSSFRHWLQRIKVHHCLNHLKKRRGKEAVSLDDAGLEDQQELRVSPVVERQLELVEDRDRVDAVLNSMPATLRVPLVMRDMDELSYEEISQSLGVGLSAVKMRVKRGREYFRRVYEQKSQLTGGYVR